MSTALLILCTICGCSLLKEAQPMEEKRGVEMGDERTRGQHFDTEDDSSVSVDSEERRLLSL